MLIMGVDPGLNRTGYGLIENSGKKVKIVASGVIRTPAKKNTQDRLNKIYTDIFELINKHKPDILILEEVFSHYKFPATGISIGYARGAVCLACGQSRVPLVSYSAKRVKKAITGKGNASKEQVEKMIQLYFKLKKAPTLNDISDALALALSYVFLEKKVPVQL